MMQDNRTFESTSRQLFRVDRKAVCYIKFIFEAYDGIALVETIDPYAACIAIHIAPGCEAEVDALLKDLRKEYLMERIN